MIWFGHNLSKTVSELTQLGSFIHSLYLNRPEMDSFVHELLIIASVV